MLSKSTQLQGIYAITDAKLMPGEQLISKAETALANGVRILQYRNKTASDQAKLAEAKRLKALCEQYHASLIINDDLNLCLQSEAHGVHLGRRDGSIREAREHLGSERILGATCHNDLHYALDCWRMGVDYCAFGRLFPSRTKPNAPHCELDILRSAVLKGMTCVGIGGINATNIQLVAATGAQMAAVIHGVFHDDQVAEHAQTLSQQFST